MRKRNVKKGTAIVQNMLLDLMTVYKHSENLQ